MTQEHILDILRHRPGTLQKELPSLTGLTDQSTSLCVQKLVKWGKVTRIKEKWTYKLYLV